MSLLTTRTISGEEEWDAIRSNWEALFAISPCASPALHFDWLRGWWRNFGSIYGAGGLRIITIWRGALLVGVMPLYLRVGHGLFQVRNLRFISTGEEEFEETCPDYMNVLCMPGEETGCVEPVWKAVCALSWDEAEFLDVPADSPLARIPPAVGSLRLSPRDTCPYADLANGFDDYLRRLSPNSRQQARRLLREGKRAGATIELIDSRNMSSIFEELVVLHEERWTAVQKSGVSAAQRFTTFHRDLLTRWLPIGRAALGRMSLDGTTLAIIYGFICNQKFDFYQSGVRQDASGRLRSPGNLAHLMMMKVLSQNGLTTYDFLRGTSAYKQRLTTDENALLSIQIRRATVRNAIHLTARPASAVFRRAARLMNRGWSW